MQRKKPVFIGELIKACISNNETLVRGMQEADVVNAWREVVGESLYDYTTRVYIRKQRLYVGFSSSAARSEFYSRRYSIIKELNRVAGKEIIKFIQVL